jgi:alkanesulfonate monooxygenase SsuD/methylene tetrahydromethanopterin reductase-like flavin-dependent oxidoreductase (luciferase family)
MRLDLSMMLWDPGNSRPYKQVLDEAVEAAQAAENAGFQGVWLSEHHFQDDGFDVSPNPVMLGTHIAHYTRTIRIGLGAVSLPLWHPLRVAEDVAMLDHISGGRVDLGLSRGISPRDIMNLNPAADRSKTEQSIEIWLEYVEVLLGAMREDAFTFKGKYIEVPYPNLKARELAWYKHDPRLTAPDMTIKAITVTPKPLQRPTPPLYNASEKPEGFAYAAERGMRPLTWYPTGTKLTAVLEGYRVAAERIHGRSFRLGEDCGLLRPSFVSHSADRVREILEPSCDNLASSMGALRGMSLFSDEGDADKRDGESWFDFLMDRSQLIAGTPREVIDRFQMFRERYGIEHFICWLNPYGVPHQEVLNAIKIYRDEIIPALKKG